MKIHWAVNKNIAYIALCALFILSACGEKDQPQSVPDAAQVSYHVNGRSTGLQGELNLALNGSELVSLDADGTFRFATELQSGDAYLVTLISQPRGQQCSIVNGSGVVSDSDVGSVVVNCVDVVSGFTVSGTVTGLGSQLNLVLNGNELVSLDADGTFTFATELQSGDAYLVTLISQPQGQQCSIVNGSGVITDSDVVNVVANCVDVVPGFTVSGTVTGLTSQLNLVLNGTELVSLDTDGSFTFATELQSGDAYLVTLISQPQGQQCIITNDSGAITDADVFNVVVRCESVNTDLVSLVFSVPGTLVPAFAPDQFDYFLEVSAITSEITATAVALNPAAVILINGSPVASGTPSGSIVLELGENVLSVLVVATNGDSRTYLVEVIRGTQVIEQAAYVKASNTEAGDFFGSVVAMSGDTLVVAASNEDSGATGVNGDQQSNSADSSGAVYVFRRVGQTWIQEAYLKASNTDDGDSFGSAISISGDTLAVGAFFEESSASGIDGDQDDNQFNRSGAVYVFRRTGASWAQEAYLKADNAMSGGNFGNALALSGETLAVGSRHESSGATGVNADPGALSSSASGAVYVFRRTAGNWTQESYIKSSNTGSADRFGSDIALFENVLAVGAPTEDSSSVGINGNQEDNSAEDSGAVYLFRRVGGTWTQEAYLKASNTSSGDHFGEEVALFEDTLAVSAPFEDSNSVGIAGDEDNDTAAESGAAYVFRHAKGAWAQEAYVKASNTDPGDQFGYDLSLGRNILAVGARVESSSAFGIDGAEDNNDAFFSGAAYVYRRAGTSWTQEAFVKPSNTPQSGQFGFSVDVSGDSFVVGAPGERSNATGIDGNPLDISANSSGAVYLFQ